ncbi:DNA internalization-related competence protein ComEC/Rec2 [Marinimicrobium agarilyticum]|uniref:DNA internalization-related competence protein ComEC/Rec2 n=1 Tax=Marinimicrobium agarilyticum TaxID=306546 RepID=UPI000427A90B|nr:DNA internalization-related competence protein ComEC/Rec2 [Marinimicrobium agarilyticum]
MNRFRISLPFRCLPLTLALGIALSAFVSALPSIHWFWLLPFLPLLLWRADIGRQGLFLVALGFFWGMAHGHCQLAHRLPPAYQDTDLTVTGTFVGLPDHDPRRERALMAVESLKIPGGARLQWPLRRIRVSWYGGPALHSGERWQLRLRLKRPRGFVNPGGFDYQLWLMRQQVDATGYVRAAPENRRLGSADPLSLSHWREQARDWLAENPSLEHPALLRALLVGDRSGLNGEQWALLTETGTNHLLAISGLHIGFVAVLGFALGAGLGRLFNLGFRGGVASATGHALALMFALGYSALAGFSIPTQRALIMVVVVQLALLCRRRVRAMDALSLALLAVLMFDPLAVFDTGFWLSFAAVAVLLLAFGGRRQGGRREGWRSPALQRLFEAQWVIFVGLLVPLLLLTGEATLLSPLANTLAIPIVTLLVVPWLLGAVLVSSLLPELGGWGLWCADRGLDLLLLWLESFTSLRSWATVHPTVSGASLALALLGVLLCLLPRGLPARWLGLPAIALALCLPDATAPALRLTMLDVGQGLAMVVQTPDHSLVYDTGPAYSDRMDAGSAIIAPYLRRLGVSRLDAVVISHRHDDHAGGFSGLTREIGAERVWAGEPSRLSGAKDCHHRAEWRWNDVRFRFLHAGFPEAPNPNNRSCVLWIQYRDQHIVLAGDIEREVEWRLVGQGVLPEALALLQVPHHGALSSSTPVWVAHTRPETALVSAAYQGRHGHPAADVVERYRAQGSQVVNTATKGALVFEWNREGKRSAHFERIHRRRWWYVE